MYQQTFPLRYSDFGENGEYSIHALIRHLQDVAIAHSQAVGCGVRELAERNMAWLMHNWHLEILNPISYPATITIKTDTTRYSGLYSVRDFWVLDHDGQTVVQGYAVWLLVEPDRMRPKRVTEEIMRDYTDQPQYVEKLPRLVICPPEQLEQQMDITLLRCNIDTNHHMNNARAVELMTEFVDTSKVRKLDILYKKAAFAGDKITIGAAKSGDGEQTAVLLDCEGKLLVGGIFSESI